MTIEKCKSCGAALKPSGKYTECEYCGNIWENDPTENLDKIKLANAWEALRQSDFEKASSLFEELLTENKNSYEAHWGKALADNGIIFVTDLNENKKVPTCNNITENSFVSNSDVCSAISLAPPDVAESYRVIADKIEKIRLEWLEKARKEPEYDIFISYKDSDKEHGIERTQDSIDAQDLYSALVNAGYKVFFSRISLLNKVSEQYEPYIYNALKTAKVMIVFGEKPEYFNAVWVKNEWGRYKTKIENGQKHKNSLVVVYKNMSPSDLPVVLKSRQCLDASQMTFLSSLMEHIKRVIDAVNSEVHLDRIKIERSQMAKRSSKVLENTVKTREVGVGAISEISIDEKQSVSLIYTFLQTGEWKSAQKIIDEVLFDNPSCHEAIWCRVLANAQAATTEEYIKKINSFEDYDLIDSLLNCATKEFASSLLNEFFKASRIANDEVYCKLLKVILPYEFPERKERIEEAFAGVINKCYPLSFDVLLSTIDSAEVEKYINLNFTFVTKNTIKVDYNKYFDHIFSVDEGYYPAREEKVKIQIAASEPEANVISDFEQLLKCVPDINKTVTEFLEWINERIPNGYIVSLEKQFIRYYDGSFEPLIPTLLAIANKLLSSNQFDGAKYFYDLILKEQKNCAEAYWGNILISAGSSSDANVVNSSIFIKDLPEFIKYLSLVDEDRRRQCVELSKQQVEQYRNKHKDIMIEASSDIAKLEKENLSLKEKSKGSVFSLITFIMYLISGAFIYGIVQKIFLSSEFFEELIEEVGSALKYVFRDLGRAFRSKDILFEPIKIMMDEKGIFEGTNLEFLKIPFFIVVCFIFITFIFGIIQLLKKTGVPFDSMLKFIFFLLVPLVNVIDLILWILVIVFGSTFGWLFAILNIFSRNKSLRALHKNRKIISANKKKIEDAKLAINKTEN